MAEGVGELSQASFIGTNLIQEDSLFHDLVTSPSPSLLTRSPWGLEFQYTVWTGGGVFNLPEDL